jgi:DNA transposition AAA+ family ATPase
MSDQAVQSSLDITDGFIVTKAYRLFAEFCDACRKYQYIGICYGVPGVGNTLSARHYARWDLLEPLMLHPATKVARPRELASCRSVLYTPAVTSTPRTIEREITELRRRLRYVVEDIAHVHQLMGDAASSDIATKDLVMIDEADRLKMVGLEHVRDTYDRETFGLVLIGMPGIEKRLARYPQLYSRVGFVHQFHSLSTEEVRFILEHKWQQIGVRLQPDDFSDMEAVAAVIRITGGNFRLIHRLCTQIERILQINDMRMVTKEVVEAAREQLVIGQV